jgi:hypothetical protein
MCIGEVAMTKPTDTRNPMDVTDASWLWAYRQTGTYPEHGRNGGKWLVFAPIDAINSVWCTIREATERGELGATSKVSTAKPNPNANDKSEKVICVFTYDHTDEADVWRIREALRQLGITQTISYKADADTFDGRYAVKGHRQISTYRA